MKQEQVSDEENLQGLREHPQIRLRVAALLSAVQDAGGDLKQADDAEQRLTQELRRLGQEAMQGWAEGQVRATEQDLRRGGRVHREGKKTSLAHHLRRHQRDGAAVPSRQQVGAPVCARRGSRARNCSRLLQRAITDLGADLPFAKAMDKLVEHYGIMIGESTIREVTLRHAQTIHRVSAGFPQGLPDAVADKQIFIAQIDGTMVPTVCSAGGAADRRKGKTVQWQEARVSLAHVHGSTEPVYGATLFGDVDTAGRQLRACANRAGFGQGHRVHGVGDGAPWIAAQLQQRFGSQGSYLLDFYQVCEYLSAAAKAIELHAQACQEWLETQRHRLRTQQLDAVLGTLQSHVEPPDIDDEQAPVRQCHRYLNNRLQQLDYQSAISQGLPIGSREIESAHRYIVQKRLKLPGTWWLAVNADHMLALRVNRANSEWSDYWATDYRYAA